MRTWPILCALLVLLAVLSVVLSPTNVIRDGGQVPLTVSVQSLADRPILAVSAETFGSLDSARQTLEILPPPEFTREEGSRYSAVREPWQGEAFEVLVPIGEKITKNWLGKSHRYSQFQALLVVVRYADGKLAGQVAEIPDLRQTRRVSVSVP